MKEKDNNTEDPVVYGGDRPDNGTGGTTIDKPGNGGNGGNNGGNNGNGNTGNGTGGANTGNGSQTTP